MNSISSTVSEADIVKALIRNPGETVTEDMGIPGIDWTNGAPLTNPGWSGGPYTLVNDYIPDDPADDFAEDLPVATAPAEPEDTVVIDGVVYRRA